MRIDDLNLDYNSDGVFEYETDILDTFRQTFVPVFNPDLDEGVQQGISNTKCTIALPDGQQLINCGQLRGNFEPDTDSDGGGGQRRDVETRSERRHNSILDKYPPPPEYEERGFITFDILDILYTVNLTNIFTMESPLGNYFLQYRDYTEQLTLEAVFGKTFIGFPPDDTD